MIDNGCDVVLVKNEKIPDIFEKPRTHTVTFMAPTITKELTPEKRNICYNNRDEDYLQANGSTLSATTPRRQKKRKDWTKEIIVQK